MVYGQHSSHIMQQKGPPTSNYELLELFALNDLYLKPEKCVWEQPSIDYLGLILEEGITCMDPTKVAGITNWPTLRTVKQV